MNNKMKTKIIAEIGINHNGSVDTAASLIKAAKEAECWGVKFQYRNLSRMYTHSARELGDEILISEINKNYLSPKKINELVGFSRSLGLSAGISFFDVEDFADFINMDFDFYKIPSAEMMNIELIIHALKYDKPVLISTGMHSEEEIEKVFAAISSYNGWVPLYCVSNYPTSKHNVHLELIDKLAGISGRACGYSSHDDNLGVIFAALSKDLPYFERHITLNKSSAGLDHSSSSTYDEFKWFSDFLDIKSQSKKDIDKYINQGEIINRQNLGRSWYAIDDLDEGVAVNRKFFEYRSPQTGLDWLTADEFFSNESKMIRPISKNQALSVKHLSPSVQNNLTDDDLKFCIESNIGVPVRPHDLIDIHNAIPCRNYEFHFSFKDIQGLSNINKESLPKASVFSIHAPDYISSDTILDPFSTDYNVANESERILGELVDYANNIQEITGCSVPIVSSLSNLEKDEKFYDYIEELLIRLNYDNFTLQWLPPLAWYFGGTVKLGAFCSPTDISEVSQRNLPITLDTSHFLLGRNYYGWDQNAQLDLMLGQIKHMHLSDAIGYDGEGTQISENSPNNNFFNRILAFKHRKILEVWRGHVDSGSGFITAIKRLRFINGQNV